MLPALLPVLLLFALGIAFTLLTRRVSQRVGRSANRFGASDMAHDFVGQVYRVGGAILFLYLLARTLWPEIDAAAGLIPSLTSPAVAWIGLAILVAGSLVILAAQVQMGASWRIGLDQERTGLVTTGLFAWSRNPTFLGMMAVVLGAFLIAPTTVTAAVLIAAWIAFSVQIRMEEEHLHRVHGVVYDRYRAAVSRWIAVRFRKGIQAADNRPVDRA